MEKHISNGLADHLALNNLIDVMQSFYRPLQTTETALLKVQNDVLSLNEGSAVVLLILDISAAFDTIDYQILSRLHDMYDLYVRIRGDAHSWFNSYLSDITQQVNISSVLSDSKKLTLGVPLTWTYFVLYVHQPVSSICHIIHMLMTLNITITKDRNRDVMGNMKKCVDEIKIWLTNNMLKLNNDKSELFAFAPQRQVNAFKKLNINIGYT